MPRFSNGLGGVMKSIKAIIICLIILLILSVILLIFINSNKIVNTNDNTLNANIESQESLTELNEYIARETDDNNIFAVNEYINQMIEYENQGNSDAVRQIVSNYQEIESLNLKQKQSLFYVQEIYSRESLAKGNYFVRGILRTIEINDEETLSEIYLKVDLDYTTNALQISVINQATFDQTTQDTSTSVEEFSLEPNEYNRFEQKSYSAEEFCNKYLSDFIIKLKYDRELAFDFVDDEYKKIKFDNDFSTFNEYIDDNQDRIFNATIQSYLENIQGNITEYIILDTYNNYYTIKSTGGLEYKIILDNYTIESEEFILAYEQATEQEKVTTNISKVVQWINTKDYAQIYNKLDQEFKQNNFPDLDTFETYIQEKFFSFNNMEVQSIEKISDNYICEVSLSSGYGVAAEQITKTFIMQLKEGTDFVMSFTV